MEVGSHRSILDVALADRKLESSTYFKGKKPISFRKLDGIETDSSIPKRFPKTSATEILCSRGTLTSPPLKRRIAVMFSGGPASGGHNVLLGIRDVIGDNELIGIKDGPAGLLRASLEPLGDLDSHANSGGFDVLGTGRKKIKTEDEMMHAKRVLLRNDIDALIVIGGDDSNTNAAILAEELFGKVQVIGVPKTIDGDLQIDPHLPITFGFDTATKIYSEMIGNLSKDVLSTRKYWHVCRLMGRDASHVTLEVALQTHPNLVFISEECKERRHRLKDIVDRFACAIEERRKRGKDYGIVLLPEGILESIPEFTDLLDDLNRVFSQHHWLLDRTSASRLRLAQKRLGAAQGQFFKQLPHRVQEMLCVGRDDHGNLNLSRIPTEELLIEMVKERVDFEAIPHFFGYEGRCGVPSGFDRKLAYNLGLVAGSLVLDKRTSYMAACTADFQPRAVPIVPLLSSQNRSGVTVIALRKSPVSLTSRAFKELELRRKTWLLSDDYISPGPRQLLGKTSSIPPLIVQLR